MSIWENISLSLSSLRSNKMRSLLTMLGIIIGIGAVIGIVTVGDALTSAVSENLSSFGANTVQIFVQSKRDDVDTMYDYVQLGESDLITQEMMDMVMQEFAGEVDSYSLEDMVGSGTTTSGRNYANLSLTGVTTGYATDNSITIQQGRFLNQNDEDGYKRVAVVSDKLVANMFGTANPIGQQIAIETNGHVGIYTIVGVYTYEASAYGGYSASSDKNITTNVYIPITTANKITGTRGYSYLNFYVNANADASAVADSVAAYVNRFYSRNTDFGVQAVSMESMLDSINQIFDTIKIAIAAIAAISLLVGGIGVMNIMLVSITERTNEIGIRKALGATNGEIRTQFIVEAIVVCLVGGLIGIALGALLGGVGASLMGTSAAPTLGTILMATGFSMAIGVFFGYYPANKAAKLDPIEALRYE